MVNLKKFPLPIFLEFKFSSLDFFLIRLKFELISFRDICLKISQNLIHLWCVVWLINLDLVFNKFFVLKASEDYLTVEETLNVFEFFQLGHRLVFSNHVLKDQDRKMGLNWKSFLERKFPSRKKKVKVLVWIFPLSQVQFVFEENRN